MTEFSFPWGCSAVGDGGPYSFSLEIVEDTNKFLCNADPTIYGVIPWGISPYSGLLAATNPSGNTVRIASGVGMVEGWLYTNDANVDFDVGGGNANATDLIVLRRSNPGSLPQTVRLALVRGPAAGVATVTQTSSVWEIALWEVVLNGAGNFSSLTDVREYVIAPIGASYVADLSIITASIAADAVTPAKIPNRTRKEPIVLLPISSGGPTITTSGIRLADGVDTEYLTGYFTVPKDYVSGGTIKIVGYAYNNCPGDIVIDYDADWGAIGESYNTHSDFLVGDIVSCTTNSELMYLLNVTPSDTFSIDDHCHFNLARQGTDGNDDLNSYFVVWDAYFEYTADS